MHLFIERALCVDHPSVLVFYPVSRIFSGSLPSPFTPTGAILGNTKEAENKKETTSTIYIKAIYFLHYIPIPKIHDGVLQGNATPLISWNIFVTKKK